MEQLLIELLLELLKSSPIGVGIIVIVWIFLQHLDRRDEAFRQDLSSRDKFIESLWVKSEKLQQEANQVMRENTALHMRTADAISRLIEKEHK